MSTCDRLLRARFNPCADRVEALGQSLDGLLDAASEAELLAHLETCRRCRGYHLFLEAASRGFRAEGDVLDRAPSPASELPGRLQEELVEAQKRNLSLWLMEAGRAVMYREGWMTPFYFDPRKVRPLDLALDRSRALLRSLRSFRVLSTEDSAGLGGTDLLLRAFTGAGPGAPPKDPAPFFTEARALDRRNLWAYQYHAELDIQRRKLISAEETLREGLSLSHGEPFEASFANNIGRVLIGRKRVNEAKQWLVQSLNEDVDIDRECPFMHMNLALCSLELNDPESAFHSFEQAMVLFEDIPSSDISDACTRFSMNYIVHYVRLYYRVAQEHDKLISFANRFGRIST